MGACSSLHPVRIARIRLPRFVPRVGLPGNRCLIGSLTAALRFSKGWVRKDANLRLRTGCKQVLAGLRRFRSSSTARRTWEIPQAWVRTLSGVCQGSVKGMSGVHVIYRDMHGYVVAYRVLSREACDFFLLLVRTNQDLTRNTQETKSCAACPPSQDLIANTLLLLRSLVVSLL